MAVDTLDTASPTQQPDALDRLLDAVLGGDDVTLFIKSDDGHRLLDAAAGCLSTLHCRVFRAEGTPSEGLSLPVLLRQAFGQPGPGVTDDEFLKANFGSLTTLDAACERVVLLISDANTLRPSALRFIQLACREGTHLQLVLAGKRGFLDLLGPNEFAHLRERLATGPIITPPLPGPRPAAVQRAPAAVAPSETMRAPSLKQAGVRASQQHSRPMLSSIAHAPRRNRLVALAGIGVGVAACIAAAIWTGSGDEPAISDQQAIVLVEPPPVADAAAVPPSEAPSVPAAAPMSAAAPMPETPVLQALRPPAAAQEVSIPVAPLPSAAVPVAPNPPKIPSRKMVMQRVLAARAAALTANSVTAWEDPYPPAPRDLRSMPPPQAISDPPEQAKSYVGTYTTDANGIRVFRLGH